jgi:predicted AlkP superfamily phosphohydrolase/phosphomutase
MLEKTLAYAATNECKGVYINDKGRFVDGTVAESDVNALREEIIRKLESLRAPSGERVFAEVWRKEDLYWGEHLRQAPDIVLEPNLFVSFLLRSVEPFDPTPVNYHSPDGVFLAWGADIARNTTLAKAQITDLVPTILHLMDLPIPEDVDGQVLRQALRADSEPAKRATHYRAGTGSEAPERGYTQDEDADVVEQRLRDLGYLT